MREVKDSILKQVIGTITPEGDGQVSKSIHFAEIVARILNGWAWQEISDWLQQTYTEVIEYRQIRAYYENYLYDDYRDLRNQERDLALDELQEMILLYYEVKRRNREFMDILDSNNQIMTKELQASISLEQSLLKSSIEMKKMLGLIESPEPKTAVTPDDTKIPIHPKLLASIEEAYLESVKQEIELERQAKV